jgi:hypothetical protein
METYTLVDGHGTEYAVEDAGSGGGRARFTAPFSDAPPAPWRLRRGSDRQVFGLTFRRREGGAGGAVWVADVQPSARRGRAA